jgi:hypothetical protein
MRGPARAMAALLQRSIALVPADRREWTEAIWAETAEVPAGWRQLSWLTGGLWLALRQVARARRLGYPLVFAAAAAGTAWSAWSGPAGDSAIVPDRVEVITITVILAGLPWVISRGRVPVAGSKLARLVRTGGYAAVLALVLVKTEVERVADARPNNLGGAAAAWTGEAAFIAVMAGYAAVILAYTAPRSPAVPATVADGTVVGVVIGVLAYLLGPLGFPLRFTGPWPAHLYDAAMALGALLALCCPVAAGLAATRRACRSQPACSSARQGARAGLWTGMAAALTVAVLSTATIALLPHDTGLRQWAADHIGRWTPVVGHWGPVLGPGTRVGYVAGNSAFAAGYLIVLMLSPLLGWALGAWGARVARIERPGSGNGGPPDEALVG